MAAGDVLTGRRVPDVTRHHEYEPGDYGRVNLDGKWIWRCSTPNGQLGNLGGHDVTEHIDGTITVSPSILVQGRPSEDWHGYLEKGVWREV